VMGHSPAVHSEVYGSWTDDRVIDDAFEASIKARVQRGDDPAVLVKLRRMSRLSGKGQISTRREQGHS
jgi:hypothetical protein